MSDQKEKQGVEASLETLQEAVEKFDRDGVCEQIKAGVTDSLSGDELEAVYADIMTLRDMRLVDMLAKKAQQFTPGMFAVDVDNWRNREFLRDVMDKYTKKFDWNDEAVCNAMFSKACQAGSTKALGMLVKKKMAMNRYPMMAESSDEVFALLLKTDIKELDQDTMVSVLLSAAKSSQPQERIHQLVMAGYDLQAVNQQGKSAANLLEDKVKKGKYPSNKKGDLARKADRSTLAFMRKLEQEDLEAQQKEKRMRTMAIALAVVVLGLVIVIFSIWYNRDQTSDDTSETSTEETDTSDDTDTTEDEDPVYSTDTSLVTADGDTVNIDYTGYVDGVAFDGGSTNGAGTSLTLGSGQYIDGFEEQLVGHNVGDEVEVTVTFPDPYPNNTDLSGKEAVFEVTINGIYVSE